MSRPSSRVYPLFHFLLSSLFPSPFPHIFMFLLLIPVPAHIPVLPHPRPYSCPPYPRPYSCPPHPRPYSCPPPHPRRYSCPSPSPSPPIFLSSLSPSIFPSSLFSFPSIFLSSLPPYPTPPCSHFLYPSARCTRMLGALVPSRLVPGSGRPVIGAPTEAVRVTAAAAAARDL